MSLCSEEALRIIYFEVCIFLPFVPLQLLCFLLPITVFNATYCSFLTEKGIATAVNDNMV
jgi:hypothetical protein